MLNPLSGPECDYVIRRFAKIKFAAVWAGAGAAIIKVNIPKPKKNLNLVLRP